MGPMSCASSMGPPVRQCDGTGLRGVSVGDGMIGELSAAGQGRRRVGDVGSLSLAVGLAVEDEFVGGGLQPVDG